MSHPNATSRARQAARTATCKRKQTYLSWTTATNAAWLLNLIPGRNLEPYGCQICGDYHLTTKRNA